eukprot:TRINITY_DN5890_c0_g2_i1.p1 TRINITY_DN5890_c0_g2~~TRINITY_DN5890_c0_g2_i1.p1  ORF type:complete len:840 (-),score=201.27 TRINITY_DN5890_c0_g2_i1:96-2615(-)
MAGPCFTGTAPSPCRARSSLGAASLRSSLGSVKSGENNMSISRELMSLSVEKAKLDPLFGARLRKPFGDLFFTGQVIAIDVDVASGERAYHVAYEDGDEEHLGADEVKSCFVHPGPLATPAGSRRVSQAPTPFSCAPTPRVSSAGAAMPFAAPQKEWVRAGPAGSKKNDMLSQVLASPLPVVAVAAIAIFLAVWSLSGCWTCLAGTVSDFVGFYGSETDAVRGSVAGLSPPLPPWAQESDNLPTSTLPTWIEEQATAAAIEHSRPSSEQQQQPSLQQEVQKQQAPPAREGSSIEAETAAPLPDWARDKAPAPRHENSAEAFAQLPADEIPPPPKPAPPAPAPEVSEESLSSESTAQSFTGGAAASPSNVDEEELAKVAAAAAEAAALVLRVASKSFLTIVDEVWQTSVAFIVGLASAAIGLGDTPQDSSGLYVDESDEAASLGGSFVQLLALGLVTAGVLTLIKSAFPFSMASSARAPGGPVQGVPSVAVGAGAASVIAGYQVPNSPMPRRLVSAPSPPPLRQAPSPNPQDHRLMASLAPPASFSASAPSPPKVQPPPAPRPTQTVENTPAMRSQGAAPAQGRTLMGLMGRTPATGVPMVAGRNLAQSQSQSQSDDVMRRPPPPPASLMQDGSTQFQQQQNLPQVNTCYVEAAPQSQERVVKVIALRGDAAFVQPYVCNRNRTGKVTFSRDRRYATEVVAKVVDLIEGPFHIAAGGRAPQYIIARFGGTGAQDLPAVPEFRPTEPKVQGYSSQAPTPAPVATPLTSMSVGSMAGSRLLKSAKFSMAEESRFRYTGSLRKLEEMGFSDSQDMREVLTKYAGDIGSVLREINGSPFRPGRA